MTIRIILAVNGDVGRRLDVLFHLDAQYVDIDIDAIVMAIQVVITVDNAVGIHVSGFSFRQGQRWMTLLDHSRRLCWSCAECHAEQIVTIGCLALDADGGPCCPWRKCTRENDICSNRDIALCKWTLHTIPGDRTHSCGQGAGARL